MHLTYHLKMHKNAFAAIASPRTPLGKGRSKGMDTKGWRGKGRKVQRREWMDE